jgi:phage gp16-like protein
MSARQQMLAKVHIARKALALTEDSYRDLVRRVTGHDSAGACDDAALDRLLGEFRRLGWAGAKAFRPAAEKALVRKIHALWRDMAPLLSDPSDRALRSFVQRQTRSARRPDGVSAPEFLGTEDAVRVIEGLKGWRARLAAAAGQRESA